MQGLIDRGKYKVIEVLDSDENCEVCLCIDVMVDSGYKPCLINTYKSKQAIKELLPLFYDKQFQKCSGFQRLVTEYGSISVVFDYHSGESFDSYFAQKPALSYEDRTALAQSMLLSAIELDMLDDRLAAGVLRRCNAVVDSGLMKISFNCVIPVEYVPQERFRSVRLGKMLCSIFPPDRKLPIEIDRFIIDLLNGGYGSCVEIYSAWRDTLQKAEETLKLYEKESFLKRCIRRAKEKKIRKRNIPQSE